MSTQLEALLDQARALSPEERVMALDALQELVSPPDATWESAWATEVDDRIAAYERGDIAADNFDLVMDQLRKEFLGK
jgi:hypothetical protein